MCVCSQFLEDTQRLLKKDLIQEFKEKIIKEGVKGRMKLARNYQEKTLEGDYKLYKVSHKIAFLATTNEIKLLIYRCEIHFSKDLTLVTSVLS